MQWNSISAIVWNDDGPKSRIMDLDLDLTIPSHMARSWSGYFFMMDNMSPQYGSAKKSQWIADIMEVSTLDL